MESASEVNEMDEVDQLDENEFGSREWIGGG